MTKTLIGTLMAAGLLMMATAEAGIVNSLADLKWEKRIVVIVNPEHRDRIIDTLDRSQPAIRDRHIAWFVVAGDAMDSNMTGLGSALLQSVRDRVGTTGDQQEVVLIGKDGGVKDRSQRLDLERLFAMIDSMPMRRQEMRQNGD